MDSQLMGLIEALEGRLGRLRQGDLGAGAQEQGAPAEPQPPPAPIQPPEPDPECMQQLADMVKHERRSNHLDALNLDRRMQGFFGNVASKALILNRNRLPEAIEW